MKFSLLRNAGGAGALATQQTLSAVTNKPRMLKASVLSLCVLAGLQSYSFDAAPAFNEALLEEQELAHYQSAEDSSNLNIKSLLDQSLDVRPGTQGNSNLLFIRDSIAHRNDLMCSRDSLYAKEISSQRLTYLGCSISPSVGRGGASINTFSLGDEFRASYSETLYGEHKELRTDVVFPSDFKDRSIKAAGTVLGTDASRLAVDLIILSRGDPDILATDKGIRAMSGVLAEKKYLHRWVAAGKPASSFWQAQLQIGSINQKVVERITDVQSEHGEVFLQGWSRSELAEESQGQLDQMQAHVNSLFNQPAIAKINEVLDHQCSFTVSKATMGGYSSHNYDCVAEAGLARSPQLMSELAVKENLLLTDQVHGALENKMILGSYKGHAVITPVVPRDREHAAFVRLPESAENWSTTFLKGSFYQPIARNVDSTKDIAAIADLHFAGDFSEKHTPIMVSPALGELLNLKALDEKSQRLMVEMTLEHEIKHIKDVLNLTKRGFDPSSLPYAEKEAACDMYAIDVLFQKYKNPEVLRQLRSGIEVRAASFQNKTENDLARIQERSGFLGRFFAAYDASKSTESERVRHEIVLDFLDNKIKASATPASKGISL